MGQQAILLCTMLERLPKDKHASLLGPFVRYEETSVVQTASGLIFTKLLASFLRLVGGSGCLNAGVKGSSQGQHYKAHFSLHY